MDNLVLQKSVSIKNALFKRKINLEIPIKKNEVHQYEYCRNLFLILMKESKQIGMMIYGKA